MGKDQQFQDRSHRYQIRISRRSAVRQCQRHLCRNVQDIPKRTAGFIDSDGSPATNSNASGTVVPERMMGRTENVYAADSSEMDETQLAGDEGSDMPVYLEYYENGVLTECPWNAQVR